MALRLKKMTEEEFANFQIVSKTGYVNDKMKAESLTRKEAEKVAEDDFARFLPEGYSSKDNFLNSLINEEENIVGYLWYVIRGPENNRKAFIGDIRIYDEYQGKGYGKKAMLLLEESVKELGLDTIGLHVFGFNERAINLYKSLNYEVTNLMMAKKID